MSSDVKVTLFMAISANGMVADLEDKVPWSPPIWEAYFDFVRSAGSLVVGRRTYELMTADEEIAKLGNIKIAVLSRTPRQAFGAINFFSEPDPIIEYFMSCGIEHIILGGGPKINSLFLRKNLINEVVLDTDPIFMPQGKTLFDEDVRLPLRVKPTRTRNLGGGCHRFHYEL